MYLPEAKYILGRLRDKLDDTRGPIDAVSIRHADAVQDAILELLEALSED